MANKKEIEAIYVSEIGWVTANEDVPIIATFNTNREIISFSHDSIKYKPEYVIAVEYKEEL